MPVALGARGPRGASAGRGLSTTRVSWSRRSRIAAGQTFQEMVRCTWDLWALSETSREGVII